MLGSSKYTKLTISGIYIALFLVIMTCTQSFAFGQYQVRIANVLYGLSALYPFLVLPATLAVILSNVLGGMGLIDMLGGGFVGFVTTALIVIGKRYGFGNWFVGVVITLVPSLIVPVWLSAILQLPYLALVASLLVGQGICGVLSVMLVSSLERVGMGVTAEVNK